MMRTLTHVPLAMAGALIPVLFVAAALIVWVAVAIRTRLGRARPAEAGTEQASSPLGATGPGVVSLVSTTPGPDTQTRAYGREASSAGYARSGCRSALDAEAKGSSSPGAADTGTARDFAAAQGVTAPEGAPAALSGATPDPIDEAIDVAAALLSPASPVERDGEFADAVARWLYAANGACINCGMLIEDAHYGAELPLWQHAASKFVGCPDGGLFAAPRPPVVPGRES